MWNVFVYELEQFVECFASTTSLKEREGRFCDLYIDSLVFYYLLVWKNLHGGRIAGPGWIQDECSYACFFFVVRGKWLSDGERGRGEKSRVFQGSLLLSHSLSIFVKREAISLI